MLFLGVWFSVCLSWMTGCTQLFASSPAGTNPIKVGIIASLSGVDGKSGEATRDAAQMAAAEVNQAGGLELGVQRYPVELIFGDTQSSPEGATSAARTLINRQNVVAIVGPQYSRYAIPVSRVAEQARIPMISPRSTNPETTAGKRFVFRATFTDTFQGYVVARFAREDLQASRAAVLYDIASPYNQGIAEVFRQKFVDLGGEIVAYESYTTGSSDFTSQLSQIKIAEPEVLFLPNYENEVPLQAAQARQMGITATLLGADAWGSMRQIDRHVDALEGAYFSDQYISEVDNEKTQGFIQRFRDRYDYEPEANAAATYDSMGILFKAIQTYDSVEPDAIRQAIANLGTYNGVTGTLEYSGSGDPITSVAILQIKDGRDIFFKEINP